MATFTAVLEKFGDKGEKTGWTYINVPAKVASVLKPGNKKTFRVKGLIDSHQISAIAIVPMGNGNFILPVNAGMRKAIKKIHGASVKVALETDTTPIKISEELIECLQDDPDAEKYFIGLPPSHRNWYSNWVREAKTDLTRSKRIAAVVKACSLQLNFGEMIQHYRDEKKLIQ